jgi:peptidoglycan/xylan/chitin deacetylase (PgdA/CDA1 family)
VSILCYHAFDAEWISPLAVEPEAFAAQADWLSRRRLVVDLDLAIARLDRRGRLPRRMAALTFDDGFASVFEVAWPVLRDLHLPITVFLVAGTLTEPGLSVDWVDDPPPTPLRTMTLGEALEMQDGGAVIGSHSYVHANLTELSDEECVRDLRESRELLSELLGKPVDLLAYPRGLNDGRVRTSAARAGYRAAFTLPEAPEPVDRFGVPRVGIYRGNRIGHLAAKSSPSYLAARLGPAYRLARALRGQDGRRPVSD